MPGLVTVLALAGFAAAASVAALAEDRAPFPLSLSEIASAAREGPSRPRRGQNGAAGRRNPTHRRPFVCRDRGWPAPRLIHVGRCRRRTEERST